MLENTKTNQDVVLRNVQVNHRELKKNRGKKKKQKTKQIADLGAN